MIYGVIPTGFSRKPLAVILAEIEAQLITEFGPNVIQTPQSPLGQVNGLMADLTSQLWELAEDAYQSYDPDQAEGSRLDMLGRIRLLDRSFGEADTVYRQAITNVGTARINAADLLRAIQNVDGVYYRQVFVNDKTTVDEYGIPPNSIALAVLGGEGDAIATVLNRYVIPGVSTVGETPINTIEEGYCRELRITRPIETPVELIVTVRVSADRKGCPAPSPVAIQAELLAFLIGAETRPWNGQAITDYLLRSFIEARFPTVEYVHFRGTKDGADIRENYSMPFAFTEIAEIQNLEVEVVP